MAEKMFSDIYRIVVPLPNNPLRSINSYVIRGGERDLIIDTGMNKPECREALEKGLAELKVDPRKADYFITHFHSDHIGLLPQMVGEGSRVYFNRREAAMMSKARAAGGFEMRNGDFVRLAGFDPEDMSRVFSGKDGFGYNPPDTGSMTMLDDGDDFEIGEYRFKVIQTPGHSPGHLCLYDAERKLMICGDHVLAQISPNISAWHSDEEPLSEYLDSLDKVRDLPVDLALPGHRREMRDFRERIDELKGHHEERLDEVVGILDGSPMHAADVASKMKWHIKYNDWADVAPRQKWFATGEAIAHLKLLVKMGSVRSEIRKEQMVFSTA